MEFCFDRPSGIEKKSLNVVDRRRTDGRTPEHWYTIDHYMLTLLHRNSTVARRVTTVRTERGVRLTVCQGDVS